jgi:Uma2 family endonuclease
MATAIESPPDAERLSLRPGAGQRLLIGAVSCEAYELIGEAFRGRGGIRLTYDRGNLEIMTTSNAHEFYKKMLARVIELLTLTLNIPIRSCGHATCKRPDLAQGFEPDEWYYVRNANRISELRELDFEHDPPPDLAIEIEHTRSLIDRLAIYAALGVPEVWRFDGERLRVMALLPDGRYEEQAASPAFPFLPLNEVERVLLQAATTPETTLFRSFVTWVETALRPVYEARGGAAPPAAL